MVLRFIVSDYNNIKWTSLKFLGISNNAFPNYRYYINKCGIIFSFWAWGSFHIEVCLIYSEEWLFITIPVTASSDFKDCIKVWVMNIIFVYSSSVCFFYLFLISSASLKSIPFLSSLYHFCPLLCPSLASTVRELWASRCSSWIYKRQRNQRSNCQHPLDHRKSKRVPEKHLLLLFWQHQSFDYVEHNKL